MVAIAVPYELLDLPAYWMEADTSAPGPEQLADAAPSLAGALRQALSSMLPAVRPTIETAAEIAEVSPRALRRHLAAEGTGWREIVEQTRREACLRLMQDPERPLLQIASDLGYSDAAHFTRAFRRWMGESPSAYRARNTPVALKH